jgi:Thiol-disulfide isomerase and thioredoxins
MNRIRLTLTLCFSFLLAVTSYSQDQFPDLDVLNELGETVNLQDYVKEGGPKLVSLWATWCGPCRTELNALKKVQAEWKEKYDLEIITVSLDVPSMVSKAKQMAKANGWNYTFLYDGNQEAAAKLKIRSIPYSWLIDEHGNILSKMNGYSPSYPQLVEQKMEEG